MKQHRWERTHCYDGKWDGYETVKQDWDCKGGCSASISVPENTGEPTLEQLQHEKVVPECIKQKRMRIHQGGRKVA